MNLNAEQTAQLKAWVVRKLENISDADSEVLADLVMALVLPTDEDSSINMQSEEQVKKITVENLQDFLGKNTEAFVDEIFANFGPKHGAVTATTTTEANGLSATRPSIPGFLSNTMDHASHSGRKRTFYERDDGNAPDSFHGRSERSTKQSRRGRGGRGDSYAGRGGRSFTDGPGFGLNPQNGFSLASIQGSSDPYGNNNPLSAVLTMQAMGFPPLPGVPAFPQTNSSLSFQPRIPGVNTAGNVGGQPKQRCRDYDTKGFCTLGVLCPFDHGNNQIVVPGANDEYDPANSSLVMEVNRLANSTAHSSRGGNAMVRGRGRGRGRGDRGGPNSRRNRADISMVGPNQDHTITTIVVENIPDDKFNEEEIRKFFSQFGNITEVTIKTYQHVALVKYADFDAASKAYHSPKVIFENRFVKVYWHNPERGANGPGTSMTDIHKKPQFDQEEFNKQQAVAQKVHEEKMKKMKETEAAKLMLEKQRQELLKKQQEEKAKLMKRLAKKQSEASVQQNANSKDATSKEDTQTAQTDALRAQLAALEEEAKTLGIDPEMPTNQSATRGRGWDRGSYRGRGGYYRRGRGSFRGRAAPIGMSVRRLDNRPKSIAINDVEFDNAKEVALKEFVVAIDEFATIEPNPERTDSRVVSFKDRWTAEKLLGEIRKEKSVIPNVGHVRPQWVPKPALSMDSEQQDMNKDKDGQMADSMVDAMNGRKAVTAAAPAEVDYDVADDNDQWGIE